jgi:hypothetical protein
MENKAFYIPNPNRFGNGLYCKNHNMVFSVRCSKCYDQFGKDPDRTFLILKKRFGGEELAEFSLIYDHNKNPN